jgi:hypothetical protein
MKQQQGDRVAQKPILFSFLYYGQTKEILCCSGRKVLGPGSVGRLENDNNSHVTIATINK